MKKDIHPKYYPTAKVSCACGNEFTTGSTRPEIKTEICHVCHPFYTGKQKLVDTAKRVEKFQARLDKKTVLQKKETQEAKKEDKDKKTKKTAEKKTTKK